MNEKIETLVVGDNIELKRAQWRGNCAFISNYPGLLDEVLKYTWTFTGGKHPYLYSSKLKIRLHKFVLDYLYGKDNLDKLLLPDNIIEHLDNNGLNCSYENLHIISSDYNKAKAFIIDKINNDNKEIPAFISDVYYSHKSKCFQIQIFFNYNIFYINNIAVELCALFYAKFEDLFIDWLYILNSRKAPYFELSKLHACKGYMQQRPQIIPTEEEKGHTIIERDGKYYVNLHPYTGSMMSYVNKTSYRNFDDIDNDSILEGKELSIKSTDK